MIFQYVSNLFHLVTFGLAADRLDVDSFRDFRPGEYVMAANDSFTKTESQQQAAQRTESNILVGLTREYASEQPLIIGHISIIVGVSTQRQQWWMRAVP